MQNIILLLLWQAENLMSRREQQDLDEAFMKEALLNGDRREIIG